MKTILAFGLICLWANATAQILYSTDFEKNATGTSYERPQWQADGFTTATWDEGLKNRTVVDNSTSVSGTKSLKIAYPAGGFGPSQTGCQIPLKVAPQDELYMSYNLQFSENFSWGTTSYGGKLPGLSGGANCSGGDDCSSGKAGFTARFMWRTGGKLILYLYHMDKPGTYGEDINLTWPGGKDVVLERGRWYHIMERVKMNSDETSYNGEVQIWIDGQEVLLRTGLRFRSNADKIDNLYISTFHGGSDATWAPTETCHIWLDDVSIASNPENIRYKNCEAPELGQNRTLCGVESVLLESDKDETNGTFTWIKNDTEISTGPSYLASEAGEYILLYDSLGCHRRDTVVVTAHLVADLGIDRTICASSFEVLDANIAGAGLSYLWSKDGATIASAQSSVLMAHEAGKYAVAVSASGCTDAVSSAVLSSGMLNIDNVSANAGEMVDIVVNNPAANYAWYSAASGGEVLSVAKTYSAEVGLEDSFLYVQDVDGFTGLVGKANAPITWTETRFDRRFKFQTFKQLSIDSVTVYPVAGQDIVISILAADQTSVVATKVFKNVPAGEARLGLHFSVPPAVYYMSAEGTTGALKHSYDADTDINFPYTAGGIISLIGSNLSWIDAKPYYLFFYNWRVSTGNTCARTPVKISVQNKPQPDITQTISLKAGWNLISLHIQPQNTAVHALFPHASAVKNESFSWSPQQPPFLNTLSTISGGNAYLVHNTMPESISITGTQIAPPALTLQAGWNIIGCPYSDPVPFSNLLDASNCEIIKNFEGFWTPTTGGTIDSFVPGEAYFVK